MIEEIGILQKIDDECVRFTSGYNRSGSAKFEELITEFLIKLKSIIGFDMILVVQPLMMDTRLESFVSDESKDYSSLEKLRKMDDESRKTILNSIDEITEYNICEGSSHGFIDSSIFGLVIACPIKNDKLISENNGGVFFLKRDCNFNISGEVKDKLVMICEIIATAYNSYRKNQLYRTTYSIFQKMQESSKRAVCVYTKQGLIVFANKYFADLTGMEGKEVLGKNIMDIIYLKDHEKLADLHTLDTVKDLRLIKDEKAMYCEQIKPDGSTIILRKFCNMVKNVNTTYKLIIFEDITNELKNIDILEMTGLTDNLTGLGNRNMFEKDIESIYRKENFPLAVIVGDVNGLKLMNDIFGHEYGDHMLRKIADIISANCKGESVYRVGGDEFYIFLSNSSQENAEDIIRRINDDCSREFKNLNFIGISLGCHISNSDETAISNALRKAESDMYYIKSISSEKLKRESIERLKSIYQERYSNEKKRTDRMIGIAGEIIPFFKLRDSESEDMVNSIELIDIGKVSVDNFLPYENIIETDDAFEKMKKHCWIGYKIASLSYETSHLARIILCHHENWDGTGYPRGMKGNEIPFLSRIIRLIYYYDGLLDDKRGFTTDKIVNEMERRKGTIFDPSLTEIFIDYLRSK